MDNKHYTPEISDLKVGYEFEEFTGTYKDQENIEKVLNSSLWKKRIIHVDDLKMWGMDPESEINDIVSSLERNRIRTQYLTDQQIVNEGWEPKEVFGDYVCIYQKGTKEKGFELVYNFEKHALMFRKLYFYGLDEEYTNTKLSHDSLECKSVNELRDLEKLFKTK